MSILIKGIDLPKGDDFIGLEIHKDEYRMYFTKGATIREKRGQAIQIDRPHGRLIDGDELLKEYKQWLESMPYINNTMSEMGQRIVLIYICHDLEYSAPTILEAEE